VRQEALTAPVAEAGARASLQSRCCILTAVRTVPSRTGACHVEAHAREERAEPVAHARGAAMEAHQPDGRAACVRGS